PAALPASGPSTSTACPPGSAGAAAPAATPPPGTRTWPPTSARAASPPGRTGAPGDRRRGVRRAACGRRRGRVGVRRHRAGGARRGGCGVRGARGRPRPTRPRRRLGGRWNAEHRPPRLPRHPHTPQPVRRAYSAPALGPHPAHRLRRSRVIRETRFLISRKPYAVDLTSLRQTHRDPEATWAWYAVDAAWFRRRRGETVTCIGTLRHIVDDPAPATAEEFLRRYDDGR